MLPKTRKEGDVEPTVKFLHAKDIPAMDCLPSIEQINVIADTIDEFGELKVKELVELLNESKVPWKNRYIKQLVNNPFDLPSVILPHELRDYCAYLCTRKLFTLNAKIIEEMDEVPAL